LFNHLDSSLRAMAREPLFLVADNADGEATNEVRMDALFERITAGTQRDEQQVEVRGRAILVKRIARSVVWFDFKELCGCARAGGLSGDRSPLPDDVLVAGNQPTESSKVHLKFRREAP
jgi:hypothetical protein